MSVAFERPPNEKTIAELKKLFGEPDVFDDRNFLFNDMKRGINREEMSQLSRIAKQVVTVELHGDGEIKTMSDGTQYRVTPQGWQRI